MRRLSSHLCHVGLALALGAGLAAPAWAAEGEDGVYRARFRLPADGSAAERISEQTLPAQPAAVAPPVQAPAPVLEESLTPELPFQEGALPGESSHRLETEVQLGIEFPPDRTFVGEPTGAFLAGHAFALVRESQGLDVLFVMDTSRSTRRMSGIDVDEDGTIGQDSLRGVFATPDPDDSILAAEVAAARSLLGGLDPRSTRVGLVTFSGEPARQSRGFFSDPRRISAVTLEPLTHDHDRVRRALDLVLLQGPSGMTDLAAGVDHARAELVGLPGTVSEPDSGSEKVVVFLTDGQPSLPYDPVLEEENVRALMRAADRAARAGIRVHTVAIGPQTRGKPYAAMELAARTEGQFNPVGHPKELGPVIRNKVTFAQLEELSVRNLSADAPASQVTADGDGAWGALVPVVVGLNRIEVTGRASDGTLARAEVTLQFAPGEPSVPPPPALAERRNQLLERRLVELQRDRARVEQERVDRTRRQLKLEIERKRGELPGEDPGRRKELELRVESRAPSPQP